MKTKPYLISIFTLICFAFLATAVADDGSEPAANKYKIKRVAASGFGGHAKLLSWVKIDDKKSIVFAKNSEEMETSDIDTLNSFTLNKAGKAGKTNELLVLKSGLVTSAQAFWIPGMMPSQGYGLLFISFIPENAYNVAAFAMARFDENGKLTSELDVFFERSVSGDQYYSGIWLTAGVREGVIGLAMCLNIAEYSPAFSGFRGCEAWFMEYSFEGFPLGAGMKKFALPADGDLKLIRPYGPAWNGKAWMIPAVMTLLKDETYKGRGYTDEIGYQLMVLSALPKPPDILKKLKVITIARDIINIHWPTFVSPVFLPGSSGTPPAGETLKLLYTRAAKAGSEGRGINAKKYSYFIQDINKKGRKIGQPVTVKAASWNRLYKNVTGLSSEETYSYFSNAYVRKDNRIAITHSRSANFYKAADSSGKYEMQLDYLALNPDTGQTEILAQSNFMNMWLVQGPILRMSGSTYNTLNTCVLEIGGKQSTYFYFSKLPK